MTMSIERANARPRVAIMFEAVAMAGIVVELAFLSGLKPVVIVRTLIMLGLVLAVSRRRKVVARLVVSALYAVQLLVAAWVLITFAGPSWVPAVRASTILFCSALLWSPAMSRWLSWERKTNTE